MSSQTLEGFGWTRIRTHHLQLVRKQAMRIATFRGRQAFGRNSKCFPKEISKRHDLGCYRS